MGASINDLLGIMPSTLKPLYTDQMLPVFIDIRPFWSHHGDGRALKRSRWIAFEYVMC